MGRSRCCTCAVTTGTGRCWAWAAAAPAGSLRPCRRTNQIAAATTITMPSAAMIHRLMVASPSGAPERLEQLRPRGRELVIRLHHLRARLRLGDLRVAELDDAAGAVLVSRLGLLEPFARGGHGLPGRGQRSPPRADGEARLFDVDSHLLPDHLELRSGGGDVRFRLVHLGDRETALKELPAESHAGA